MKNKIVKHFYIKENRKNKNGQAPIYLRITINGERSEVSTDRRIKPEGWDKKTERAIGRSESSRIINVALDNLSSKVEKYFINHDVHDERISVRQITSELKGKGENQVTLIQAYKHHIEKIKELEGINFAKTTIDKYGYSLNSLSRFLQTGYNRTDIRLSDLDHSFAENYYSYLTAREGLKHNTAAKSIKHLNRIMNISIKNKWLINNPLRDFKCSYKNPERDYLTQEEIDRLYSKQFEIPRLEMVRDLFLFQIYTGLSYVDMTKLSKDSIEKGIDGGWWIVINRKKTGIRSSIPIMPVAQEILNKYKLDPSCIAEQKLLPFYCNQKMNSYLKEIATICKITKNLTSHVARHTFATTITLSQGVPIETVSKMLGHTDLKTTQIYSKVVDRKIANDMKPLLKISSSKSRKRVRNQ